MSEINKIIVRKAKESDIDSIVKTFSAWHKTKGQFIEYLSKQDRGESILIITEIDQNKVVGYANLFWQSRIKWHRESHIPEIVDLNVITEYQRQGIATQMIDLLEKFVLANNIQNLGIAVEKSAEYLPAEKLYKKLGYRDEGKESVIDGELVSVKSKRLAILRDKIEFKKLTKEDMPLFNEWAKRPYVKGTWFQEGYEILDKYENKIAGNGYDYPFIIFFDNKPIGYIQTSDLYAYRTMCPTPKGVFTNEDPETFCLDLFIGEEDYLNKGYGTKIVKSFVNKLRAEFNAKKILIDPACSNKRAIRCYEKAGFKVLRKEYDGTAECCIMEFMGNNGDNP